MSLPVVEVKAPSINWDGLPKRFFNPGELEALCELLRRAKAKTIIEFGINTGRTAKAILREVPDVKEYIGIDVLEGYVTEKMVQRKEIPSIPGEFVIGDHRVQLIVKKNGSHDLTSDDLPECDAVFIDGDHSRRGVENDTKLARAKVRKGGIIIWHDYNFVEKNGVRVVDVADVLHEYEAAGHEIQHVEGTWLAYEIVK